MALGPLQIQLPVELFAPAESLHYEGAYAFDVLKFGPDLYTPCEPFTWAVDLTNTGDAILVMGTVEGSASTLCARCLETAEIDFFGEVEGYFLLDADALAGEEEDLLDAEVLPDDKIIDLEPLLHAALLLDAPTIPLCRDDCKGVCASCGANLNDGPCGCIRDCAEPAKENPFAVLKDFDFGEKSRPID